MPKTLSILPPLKSAPKAKSVWRRVQNKSLMAEHEVYTEEMAAKRLGVSLFTLQRIRKRGEIGYCKAGKGIRYRAEHLDAYLKSTSVPPCPKTDSKSEATGSPSAPGHPTTMQPGSTGMPDKHAACHSAQAILSKPK